MSSCGLTTEHEDREGPEMSRVHCLFQPALSRDIILYKICFKESLQARYFSHNRFKPEGGFFLMVLDFSVPFLQQMYF